MALPEEEIPLDQAALLIAAEADPSVDAAAQLSRLDEVAAQIGVADTEGVCRLLFETLGLRGDDQNYDDPRNSYLNQVLTRRLGIPISLAVLLIEIGRRCGVRLEGVGMPGHFLVRDPAQPTLLIDAFAGGRRLDHAACARLLRVSARPGLELGADMLAPVGSRAIVSRMLANLDHSFRRREDRDGLRWVNRLRAAIPGLPLAERIAVGDDLAMLGCYDEASTLLMEAAGGPGLSPEAAQALLVRARAVLAPLN
jgi:regulator of sirC expression with transglutaminase-like and TPR domain